MAFFDEPRPRRSAIAATLAAIAGHPASFVAFVLASAFVVAAALAVLLVPDEATRQLGALAGRTEISVFVRPDAAAADVDGLREGLARSPGVLEVRTIPKDVALAALAADGLSSLPVRANPLPDSFAVRLRSPAGEVESGPRIAAAAKGFAALAGVDSATYDPRWVARLDAWSTRVEWASGPLRLAVGGGVALALACIAWLAAGVVREPSRVPSDVPRASGWATGTVLGITGGIFAAMVAWVVCLVSVSGLASAALPTRPIVDPGSLMSGVAGWMTIGWICVVVLAATGAGATNE